MFIGIDGNEANIKKRVGVGEYAFQVLKHLKRVQSAKCKVQSDKVKFVIYLKDKPRTDLPEETSWWNYRVFGPQKLWTQIALPTRLYLEKEKPDVFFTPSHYAPRFSPCPTVISIMDLSFIFFPEMFKKKDLYQLGNWTKYSVKAASKVLTISKYSKEAIVEYYKVPEDKVVVTYPGYKLKVQSKKLKVRNVDIKKIKDRYKIEGDYILFVGTLQPRKNIIKLLEAFKITMKQCNNVTKKLVIVGKKGWLFKDIFKKVKELRLKNQVIFTDYVPEDELPIFYKGAKCLVNPSLYEGFGLPVLEAMACGCPVVVSNVSSLPEIVGKAGILVDPCNVDDIAKGISKALNFDTTAYASMVNKGLKQAKKFSWEKCVKKTLEVLKEVAK